MGTQINFAQRKNLSKPSHGKREREGKRLHTDIGNVYLVLVSNSLLFSFLYLLFFLSLPPPSFLSIALLHETKAILVTTTGYFFLNSLMEGASGRKLGERKKQSREKTVGILNKQIEEDKNSHNTQQLKTTKKKTLEDNN